MNDSRVIICVSVLTLSRSEPATLQDLHPGAAELNYVQMRKKVSNNVLARRWSYQVTFNNNYCNMCTIKVSEPCTEVI